MPLSPGVFHANLISTVVNLGTRIHRNDWWWYFNFWCIQVCTGFLDYFNALFLYLATSPFLSFNMRILCLCCDSIVFQVFFFFSDSFLFTFQVQFYLIRSYFYYIFSLFNSIFTLLCFFLFAIIFLLIFFSDLMLTLSYFPFALILPFIIPAIFAASLILVINVLFIFPCSRKPEIILWR